MGWRLSAVGFAAALALVACGGPSPKLAIEISSPNDTVYTNAEVTIQVAVRGDKPNKVELLRDGEVMARLTAPFQYVWDTTSDAEGTYELTARAFKEGEKFESTVPRTVIVDRTPPAIATRTPEIGDTNVYLHDDIVAVFNEPLDPKSVHEGSVLIQQPWMAQSLPVEFTLSQDAKTLTIRFAGEVSTPQMLTVDLSTVRDRAGNDLGTEPDLWEFRLPEWYLNADGLTNPAFVNAGLPEVAMSPDGLYLAYAKMDAGWISSYVMRERVKDYEVVGEFAADVTYDHRLYDLRADSQGRLLVVHTAYDRMMWTETSEILLYEEGSWTSLGYPSAPGITYPVYSYNTELGFDANDNPLAVFTQFDGSVYNVYVMRHDGTQWSLVGAALSAFAGSTSAGNPDVAISESGNIGVVFYEYNGSMNTMVFTEWDGSSWSPYWYTSYYGYGAYNPKLAYDGDAVRIAWEEYNGTTNIVVTLSEGPWGLYWLPPVSYAGYGVSLHGILVDRLGEPMTIFRGYTGVGEELFLAHWQLGTWQIDPVGILDPGNKYVNFTSATTDSFGNPVLGFYEQAGPENYVFVETLNRF